MTAPQEDWFPWQDHDGKGCPCVGQWVHVIWHAHDGFGTEFEHDGFGIAAINGDECWRWETWPKFSRIIRYRIRNNLKTLVARGFVECRNGGGRKPSMWRLTNV